MPHTESLLVLNCPENVRKLVLCFDGTGNDFQGNTADTNVVKLYDKLDRTAENQFHYYQRKTLMKRTLANQNSTAGIGTYDISGGSINKGMIGNLTSKITRSIDSAVATSFDAHVMAGYKFLMNYYEPWAKIYMFGFSRGAFIARFLARMIHTVGLLSKGNDEMIPFAYALYQDYEQAKEVNAQEEAKKKRKLANFTSTFCRLEKHFYLDSPEESYEVPIKAYFLGIFDCVRSVAVLETPFGKAPPPASVVGTANHVRHAVAVDEFRVKFKVALLHQDLVHEDHDGHSTTTVTKTDHSETTVTTKNSDRKEKNVEDIKEVWFPGNHGDVGGGWPAHKPAEKVQRKWWRVISIKLFGDKMDDPTNVKEDAYQMSDIPLSWMIRELELLGAKEEKFALKWGDQLRGFKDHFDKEEALSASAHDTMEFGRGSSWLKVLMWKFMDYVPLFPRYELQSDGKWEMRTWPANMASARNIPKSALLHASLLHRLRDTTRQYAPTNNHGGTTDPCLTEKDGQLKDHKKFIVFDAEQAAEVTGYKDKVDHNLYALEQSTIDKYKTDIAKIAAKKAARAEVGQATKSPVVNGLKAPAVLFSVQEVSN